MAKSPRSIGTGRPAGDTASQPIARTILRKKTFVERALGKASQDKRKGEAKDTIDAALAVLGDALSSGEEVNLPPLGRVKIVKEKTNARNHVLTLRLVRKIGDGASGKDANTAD